ncbi:MAG TPA: ABC transporter ATP-binding protein [Candidatus Copromonas avistercoris]|nr:ABC transporter ATP-binding protein [Candidatus Copromonas avistercoris]
MAYITFKNINKSFGSLHVLKGINLEVEKGELLTLLGPSGCGKSTLLRCLAGLEEVQEGQIFLEDQDITNLDARLRQIGMVFQQYSLFPNMTVEQNLAFGLKIQKLSKEEMKEEITKALKMIGMEDKRNSYPNQLSGGQQQRVALARAIVTKPKVLLLDEPLSAIDAKLRKNLQIEIRRIQKELNITTIFVTHDQDEAMIMSDRICLLNEGEIEQLGKPIDIYTEPKTKFAAGFIGNYNVLDPSAFSWLTGVKLDDEDSVAIRPETIAISREKPNRANAYEWQGTVLESRSRGNVLRYTIDVNGIQIFADTLFRSFSIFEDQEKVWLSVEKRNCLAVADKAAKRTGYHTAAEEKKSA